MEASAHRARARDALRGNWVTAVLVYLVAGLLMGGSESSGFNFNLNIEAGHVDFSASQELEHFLEGTLGLAMPLVLTVSLILLVARLALGGVMSMGRGVTMGPKNGPGPDVTGGPADGPGGPPTTGIPSGRLSDPEEIAGMAAFLLCEFSENTTGQVIVIDGGSTAVGY